MVGDVVVVRASAPFGNAHAGDRWNVITWGSSLPDHSDLIGLSHNDACAAARLRALAAKRRTWELRAGGFAQLRQAPLIRKSVGGTYAMNADVTDATTPTAATRWQGYANLTKADVMGLLADMGFSAEQSALLVSTASSPSEP